LFTIEVGLVGHLEVEEPRLVLGEGLEVEEPMLELEVGLEVEEPRLELEVEWVEEVPIVVGSCLVRFVQVGHHSRHSRSFGKGRCSYIEIDHNRFDYHCIATGRIGIGHIGFDRIQFGCRCIVIGRTQLDYRCIESNRRIEWGLDLLGLFGELPSHRSVERHRR
jgi:hypothetical protein